VQVPRRSALGKAVAVTLASVTVTLGHRCSPLAPSSARRLPSSWRAAHCRRWQTRLGRI